METKITNRPITFLTHPNEFIDEDKETDVIERRGTNFISYLLGDVLRHKLKVRNLGAKALPLLKRELDFFAERDFNFVTCKKYYALKKTGDATS